VIRNRTHLGTPESAMLVRKSKRKGKMKASKQIYTEALVYLFHLSQHNEVFHMFHYLYESMVFLPLIFMITMY
jgi:hypothetical protein